MRNREDRRTKEISEGQPLLQMAAADMIESLPPCSRQNGVLGMFT